MRSRLLWVMLALVISHPAFAQGWQSKPVRIIVVYPPGGTSDAVTRLLAEKLAPEVAATGAGQFAQVIRREHEANAKIVAKAGIRSE